MIRLSRLNVLSVGLSLCSPSIGLLQAQQAVRTIDIDELLERAAATTLVYDDVFRDLTADEKYTIVTYDDSGDIDETREFVSRLVIHQLTRSLGRVAYRQVLAVDGRRVEDSGERARRLSTELADARSDEQERELLSAESQEFGLAPRFDGYALRTHKFLYEDRFREAFDVTVVGEEMIEGRDIAILDYRQTEDISALNYNVQALDENARAYLRGRLWIETSTGGLWRDESGIFVENLPSFSEDPALLEYVFQYANSPYGVFTPDWFEFTTHSGRSFVQDERITQDFGEFRQFDVDVQIRPADVQQ